MDLAAPSDVDEPHRKTRFTGSAVHRLSSIYSDWYFLFCPQNRSLLLPVFLYSSDYPKLLMTGVSTYVINKISRTESFHNKHITSFRSATSSNISAMFSAIIFRFLSYLKNVTARSSTGTGDSLPRGLKRSGRQAYHTPPSSSEVTKQWSLTSAPQYSNVECTDTTFASLLSL